MQGIQSTIQMAHVEWYGMRWRVWLRWVSRRFVAVCVLSLAIFSGGEASTYITLTSYHGNRYAHTDIHTHRHTHIYTQTYIHIYIHTHIVSYHYSDKSNRRYLNDEGNIWNILLYDLCKFYKPLVEFLFLKIFFQRYFNFFSRRFYLQNLYRV